MQSNRKISNPEKVSYDGKDNDEQILYILRRSLITMIPILSLIVVLLMAPFLFSPIMLEASYNGQRLFGTLFVCALTLFWYLFTFGLSFQYFINWYFNLFIITNKKLVDMDFIGFLYKNISETPLRNIEDVTSTVTGVLGVVFNIGTLAVQTAAEKREFEFEMLDNPSEIRDVISDMVSDLKENGNS